MKNLYMPSWCLPIFSSLFYDYPFSYRLSFRPIYGEYCAWF